jgi:hypothetical protein
MSFMVLVGGLWATGQSLVDYRMSIASLFFPNGVNIRRRWKLRVGESERLSAGGARHKAVAWAQ